jgi:ApaG protein
MRKSIEVTVKTCYIAEQSAPNDDKYVYAYEITISNNGDESAQLISRYWRITDANDAIQEVKGMGVVGEQPSLAPGESYNYSSGVIIETPTGTMEGHYMMQAEDGIEFEAEIPQFTLIHPSSLH